MIDSHYSCKLVNIKQGFPVWIGSWTAFLTVVENGAQIVPLQYLVTMTAWP